MTRLLTNWKTTGAGIPLIVFGALTLLGFNTGMTSADAASSIIAGIGLIMAKDSNVTGGTVRQ